MRDRRLYRGSIATRVWQGRQLLQSRLDVACSGWRRIEREVQHGGRERGGDRDHRCLVGGGESGAEYAKIEKGVSQQRVPALELLDKILLPVRTCGQNVDCGALLSVRARGSTQPMDGLIVHVGQACQCIVV